jgi:hypothetical protein
MAKEYLQRHGDGLQTIHMKLVKRPDGLLLMRSKPDEWGRKFSPGGQFDYRVFYDNNSYDWISQIEPFGSTVTEARIVDGGILVSMPPVEKRNALMAYTGPRYTKKYRRETRVPVALHQDLPPAIQPPPGAGEVNRSTPPSAADDASRSGLLRSQTEGHMYLVLVPPEKDEKFHTLLRFLKLEALKE